MATWSLPLETIYNKQRLCKPKLPSFHLSLIVYFFYCIQKELVMIILIFIKFKMHHNSQMYSYLLMGICFKLYWIYIQVSQEECARLREGVPYVKVYRYNPKHLCPKLNGYGDNGQRKVWSSCGSTHCTCQLTILFISVLECGVIWRQFSSR